MTRFRRKPVVVEAIQYRPHENCAEVAAFVGEQDVGCDTHDLQAEWLLPSGDYAAPGWWIVRDADGRLTGWKPDEFAETYEPAAEWAEARQLDSEAYPADWKAHGKAAGPIRNQQMLDEGKPQLVLAFVDKPLEESRGTNDMVSRAVKAGVPTYVIQRMNQ